MEIASYPEQIIVIHYGEIGLKGENRHEFVTQLQYNISLRLISENIRWKIKNLTDVLICEIPPHTPSSTIRKALTAISQVFGVAWLTVAIKIYHSNFSKETWERDWDLLSQTLITLAKEKFIPDATFAVRARRTYKALPFTSIEAERKLGSIILKNTPWEKVDLEKPTITFYVDFRKDELWLYTEKIEGVGGLPVGSAGRVLVLLSGGIDSPVAAWFMAKRGCYIDLLHFSVSFMNEEQLRNSKIGSLARRLANYTLGMRLFVVPYTYFDISVLNHPNEFHLVLFRRFMLRVAEKLAASIEASAIVTGDSLSQVASQTLSNLVTTDRAVEMPVFRPLIGMDKNEIINIAKKIGTYEISIQPYKDCCALISRKPKTRSSHERLVEIEREIFPDYPQLIEKTLNEAVTIWCEPEGEIYQVLPSK